MNLTFNIPKRDWLTANRGEMNRGHRGAVVARLHDIAIIAAQNAGLEPITGRVHVHWEIRYPKGVRVDKGDPTNAHPTCKALLDGLVPTWLPDDGPLWVVAETYRRGANLDRPSDHEVQLRLVPQEVPW